MKNSAGPNGQETDPTPGSVGKLALTSSPGAPGSLPDKKIARSRAYGGLFRQTLDYDPGIARLGGKIDRYKLISVLGAMTVDLFHFRLWGPD